MKHIAVYTESMRAWPKQVEYAAALTAALHAQLTGFFICPSFNLGLPAYEVPGFEVEWADQVRELMEEACKSETSFLTEARLRGVEKAAWQVAQGYVPECLAVASNWHDVLVLGGDDATTWGSPAAVGDIMLSCDIPCVVVPVNHAKPFSLNCVAIAWNGSMAALRAIHSALPVLKRAQRIVLLEGNRLPSPMDTWRPGFDLGRYLTQHGLLVQPGALVQFGNSIGNDLLQAAHHVQADLLVMGAYGHTRLRERLLGGATREVLQQLSLPVWMRH